MFNHYLMLSLLPMKLRVVISSEVSSSNSAPEENKFEKKKVYRDFKLQPGKISSSLGLLFFNS